MDLSPHIERFSRRLAEVEAALSDPKVFGNKQRAQELSKEYSRLKDLVTSGNTYLRVLRERRANRSLLGAEIDTELAALALEDVERLEKQEQHLPLEVQQSVVPP